MAKKAYIGAPLTEVITSSNIGSWFTFSDTDGISSWSGTTLTVTGVYSNERVKFTALSDMTVSFDYTTDSYCQISFNGKYICDEGDDGSYTATLPAGKSFYFSISNASVNQTGTLTNITCTTATSVARKIKRGYVGVPTMISLGDMAEGDIVQINENGSPVDFYVAKHNYESAKNGEGRTLLVRKYCYDKRQWHSSNANDYSSSSINTWLNGTYKGLLDSNVQSAIGATWFYCTQGNNTSVAVLKRSVFLLSVTELGLSADYANTEGSALPIARTLQIASYDGSKVEQWTRTRCTSSTVSSYFVDVDRSVFDYSCTSSLGSRPCFTLPATMDVTNGLITGEEASAKEVARLIKKAYIGIGGVARPCWSTGELEYYGTITPLSVARRYPAATTVGNYALFGGGYDGNKRSEVDAYDKSLTRTSPTSLSEAKYNLAATSVGNYALFGGGNGASSVVNAKVDVYDTSLTRTAATALSEGRNELAATTVGNYALFGGGYTGSTKNNVDAYDTSLTRKTATTLKTARYQHAATTVGNYALFGGGKSGSSYISTVDAYDTSLTRTNPTSLSVARYYLAATSVGDYALFGGGVASGSEKSKVVDAYDKSLTMSTVTSLTYPVHSPAATTVGNYALFGGGIGSLCYAKVYAYDTSLTRTVPTELSESKYQHAATTVGDYALFGGGYNSGDKSAVDVYTIV